MENRVVITGLGAVSPIGNNTRDFYNSLLAGISGISFDSELADLDCRCHFSGSPRIENEVTDSFCDTHNLIKLKSTGILYGCMAGLEAWTDAGLSLLDKESDDADWDSGCILGTTGNGIEPIEFAINQVEKGNVRKIGGRLAQQAMNSGVSAYLGGIIGLGNQVTTNSSSYSTGLEAILDAYYRIKWGKAKVMLAGGSESGSKYIWAGYDGMPGINTGYALATGDDSEPESLCSPLSINAKGIVPAAGAGAMLLESLDSALSRGARIYGEVLGGMSNSGAHQGNGSMLRPNEEGLVRCIGEALKQSRTCADDISLISGYLPSNETDITEVACWANALNRRGIRFPWINSVKSMTGHCFSASGALEAVATALQLYRGQVHPTLNASELHPEISSLIDISRVPQQPIQNIKLNCAANLSMGIGDVNTCVIFKSYVPSKLK